MSGKKEKNEKKVKKEKPSKKVSAAKASKNVIKNKMIEVLLTIDPAMKEKKVLKKAEKATKILSKGVKKQKSKGAVLVAEVFEVKTEVK
ncbi:hypothetical protein [Ferruginibacter sp. HRS2-29]|uniref:hypothetical protein n=1 Tax=Ferruginibacter sp. HRS2-29 TaxID=2487334 RepID=UPI0020CB790E|nr:hypothetical protein [Ferruginibacter sp. HRS2-29]MCP9751956.1 hypothetical protein [Ferruginibacter sp. HRS2-29]